MRRAFGNGIVYATCGLVLLLFLAPILWVLVISFKLRRDIFTWPPSVTDFTPTLANYANVLSGSGKFVAFIGNSVIVALASTAIALTVGTLGAYGLSGRRRPKSVATSYWMLSFRMMPPVALLIPYYVLFQQAGLLGHLGAIALSHSVFSVAIVLWMTKSFFDEIPSEIEEAALMDGASDWRCFVWSSCRSPRRHWRLRRSSPLSPPGTSFCSRSSWRSQAPTQCR